VIPFRVTTNPPAGTAPGGKTFGFQVSVKFASSPQFFPLRVASLEEFKAIAAIFQITTGKLFLNPNGQTLIRTHVEG
jgi:hypothetical protein